MMEVKVITLGPKYGKIEIYTLYIRIREYTDTHFVLISKKLENILCRIGNTVYNIIYMIY